MAAIRIQTFARAWEMSGRCHRLAVTASPSNDRISTRAAYQMRWLSKWTERDSVTFLIPAFNAEKFIAETLRSVQGQAHPKVRALVSVDRSTDRTADVVRPFLRDGRFELFVHKERLGWARNLNFLVDKVRSRYFSVLPHDDVLEPPFTERLLEVLEATPDAVAAHSDIQCFGEIDCVIAQQSIVGDRLTRVRDYLTRHYNAVLFRAIVDRHRLGKPIHFGSNRYLDFAEDSAWGLHLSTRGEVLRISDTLYRKRYHPASYHRKWQQWDDAEAAEAWILHCARCFEIVKESGLLEEHTEEIVQACVSRFHQRDADLWMPDRIRPQVLKRETIARFLCEVIARI